MFTMDNTYGYTQEQLDALNDEWQDRAAAGGWEEGSEEYLQQQKWFADEVAGR